MAHARDALGLDLEEYVDTRGQEGVGEGNGEVNAGIMKRLRAANSHTVFQSTFGGVPT